MSLNQISTLLKQHTLCVGFRNQFYHFFVLITDLGINWWYFGVRLEGKLPGKHAILIQVISKNLQKIHKLNVNPKYNCPILLQHAFVYDEMIYYVGVSLKYGFWTGLVKIWSVSARFADTFCYQEN